LKRRWKILIYLLVALAALALLNTFVTNSETEPAEVTVEGAEILAVPGGDLQVLDVPASEPPAMDGRRAPRGGSGERGGNVPTPTTAPIVLIHGYTGSINWWQDVIGDLSRRHRVIAIDLLGHGGSAKPGSGYTIANQADLIAQILNQLDVEGAVLVGHSLGGTVVTAVAERSSELVDRLILIGMAPDVEEFGNLDLTSRISRLPVIGQATKRLAPDALLRDGLEQGFAPGFPVPDYAVTDLKRMTFTAYREWPGANEGYTAEQPLNERIEASFIPLQVIFGAEDQIFDARASLNAYAAVPAAQTELLEGVGHSPMVEAPEETVALIEAFAAPAPGPPAEPPAGRPAGPSAEESRPTPRSRERGGQARADRQPQAQQRGARERGAQTQAGERRRAPQR